MDPVTSAESHFDGNDLVMVRLSVGCAILAVLVAIVMHVFGFESAAEDAGNVAFFGGLIGALSAFPREK